MIDDNDPKWKPGKPQPVEPLLSNGQLVVIAVACVVIDVVEVITGGIGIRWATTFAIGIRWATTFAIGLCVGKLHERSLW